MKFGVEEELIMWIMKTSITQIWMVCHLLPFAKVGQYYTHKQKISSAESQNVVNAVQRCSVENQKDNIAIDFVPR